MLLSQTAEYALRATIHIATHEAAWRDAVPGGAPHAVRVNELAAALGLPQNYLAKTLHRLARSGVLASTRGPTGGFRLAVPAERLALARVVAVFEEPQPRRCLLGTGRCGENPDCPVHARWSRIAAPVTEFFATTMIADLIGARDVAHAASTRGAGGDLFPQSPSTRRAARQESTP